MEYQTIIVETKDKVGVITLNRPKALNALNDQLMDELGFALKSFDQDEAIACIVIAATMMSGHPVPVPNTGARRCPSRCCDR